ncbi:helix-turn-helix domain-containing protein [Paenibacillus elgii]|uniref:helix-turn-helix domain-containing protein n=1 Tax=Paenibacillus elgii TaxID=189691 RepID=UPI000248C6B8|nr:helix-turn-helix domain-containing protein [Paenibacillus elgii]
MSNKRSWTKEQDEMLANTVLDHIKRGKSRIAAFEIVGARLLKTPNTVKHRWDTVVRDMYDVPKEVPPEIDQDSLGYRLKTLRTELKYTQEEVAKILELNSRNVLSSYESNRSSPPVETIIKFSELYNVSCDFLLRGKEFKKRKDKWLFALLRG